MAALHFLMLANEPSRARRLRSLILGKKAVDTLKRSAALWPQPKSYGVFSLAPLGGGPRPAFFPAGAGRVRGSSNPAKKTRFYGLAMQRVSCFSRLRLLF